MKTIKFNFKFLYNDPIKVSVNIGSIEEFEKELLKWPKTKQGCCVNKLIENRIDIYVSSESIHVESTMIHELVHAVDIICNMYLEIETNDVKTKSQVLRYFVEKSEKLLEPLDLSEGYKDTNLLSVFLLGIPLKIEISNNIIEGDNFIAFRKNKWVYNKPTKKDGIVLKSVSSRGCLAEVLSYFVFDMFFKKHIDDTETRAYCIGGLWNFLTQKEVKEEEA